MLSAVKTHQSSILTWQMCIQCTECSQPGVPAHIILSASVVLHNTLPPHPAHGTLSCMRCICFTKMSAMASGLYRSIMRALAAAPLAFASSLFS